MAARKMKPPAQAGRTATANGERAPTREELNVFLDSLLARGDALKREMEELSERIARPLSAR